MSNNNENENKRELPKYITNAKNSYIHGQYPLEDVHAGVFEPFLYRKRTWLVVIAFILLILVKLYFKPDTMGDAKLNSDHIATGLAIFICVAILWLTEAIPLAVTALLVPILGAVMGISAIKVGLQGFSNPLIYLFFGGFAMAAALAYQGIDKWLANRIIILSGGRMMLAIILLFVATAFLSMWISNTATTAMMIPLILGMIGQINIEDKHKKANTAIFILLGCAYAASIGGMGSVVGSPPNAIAAEELKLSFQDWLKFGIPAVLILLPAMIIILYAILRPSLSQTLSIEKIPFRWTRARKITLVIFVTTALCWIFSKYISKALGSIPSFDTVIALSAIFVLIFFRVVRWRDIDRATDWGVLLLFGGGIALSSLLGKTGTSLYLAKHFSSAVSDLPVFWVIGLVVLFVIILTELSSNTATAALFVPLFYSVAIEMGIEPSKLIITLALTASSAFMLPVATPPNAIVFATGKIPQKVMMKVGVILNIAFVVLLTLLSSFLF